jgi:hypothetical protein
MVVAAATNSAKTDAETDLNEVFTRLFIYFPKTGG